jgi:uncharacterized protein (TIGR01777 family)
MFLVFHKLIAFKKDKIITKKTNFTHISLYNKMSKSILITGGSGLVGTHLTKHLIATGYTVKHLSRTPGTNPNIETFVWDIGNGTIDPNCIKGVDTIIHLAGAGIAEERWTDKRKQLIISSRTDSIKLLYDLLKKETHQVKHVISASGIGYYSDRGDEILTEESSPNTDFLAQSCILWEKAVDEGKLQNLQITKFRTGIVLTKDGGALPKLAMPVKLYIGSPFGDGEQWFSWIHIDDVVNMYVFAIENENMNGTFNMAAPQPVRNKDFVKILAGTLGRPIWAPAVPKLVIKALLGEMSKAVMGSTHVSVDKITGRGFNFKFPDLKTALKDIYEQ